MRKIDSRGPPQFEEVLLATWASSAPGFCCCFPNFDNLVMRAQKDDETYFSYLA
jgi:hypothetical protein